jgi:AcrR family transcriptional regulator
VPRTKQSPAPRWKRRPEARPEEILDAALAVFGEQGFAGAKLDDVARRAGVSKGTLYLYFDSKETLFREMVRAHVVAAITEGEEMVRAHDGTARALLVKLMRRMWLTVRSPQMARIGRLVQSELTKFPELARFYFDEVILRSRQVLQAALERGIASGEFQRPLQPFVARAIASLLVHSGQQQCFFASLDPNALDDDQVIDGVVDLVLNGVLARPAAARLKD